jgi:antitoxin component of MazEF toxin-antitoxin module
MGYPATVQLIVRPKNQQWYVNLPNALAMAIDLRKGERIEWEIHNRSVLVLVRTKVPAGRALTSPVGSRKRRKGRGKAKI